MMAEELNFYEKFWMQSPEKNFSKCSLKMLNSKCDLIQFLIRFMKKIGFYFNRHGYNGNHCLLKTICEATQHQFGQHNGLIGDLIHVLFT